MDRSKGDTLSKGVALAQGLWFTSQCLARVHQGLPVTELEPVATLAYSVVNIFIWGIWWSKPLDVREPILIGLAEDPKMPRSGTTHRSWWQPRSWWESFKAGIDGATSGYYLRSSPSTTSISPTSFWSSFLPSDWVVGFPVGIIIGATFGAIHCAAWRADFPSADEMWMWRLCSALVTALPVAMALPPLLLRRTRAEDSDEAKLDFETNIRINPTVAKFIIWILVVTYVIARLFLIILPFTTLRALPLGAFVDVDWSVYIPHL
jgi:hypothetical protein